MWEDLSKVGNRAKPAGEQTTGDRDAAFKAADVTVEGEYLIPVITHCCLEPHGQTVAWSGDKVEYFPSTQNVSGIGTDLGKAINVPATNIHVHMDYMGGGFGSKFPSDLWGVGSGAALEGERRQTGKALPRTQFRTARLPATVRGVGAKIKIGAKNDGTITVWESQTWATGGFGGGGLNAQLFPYVFTKVPNRRINHTAVSINTGSARAWRAPNHPQVSYLTCSAIEDLAAKLKMDPTELFKKNLEYTARPEVYAKQIDIAAGMIDWKKNWHQRGDSGSGPIRRGLGMGIGTWGGQGHASKCRTDIHPDGSVEVELGSQDLGTATRTMIAMIASETLGLPISKIKIKIGDNSYPNSGGSGGSTTIGGVTTSTRKSTVNALDKLFEKVAPLLNTTPDQLEASDGRIAGRAGHPAAGGRRAAGRSRPRGRADR